MYTYTQHVVQRSKRGKNKMHSAKETCSGRNLAFPNTTRNWSPFVEAYKAKATAMTTAAHKDHSCQVETATDRVGRDGTMSRKWGLDETQEHHQETREKKATLIPYLLYQCSICCPCSAARIKKKKHQLHPQNCVLCFAPVLCPTVPRERPVHSSRGPGRRDIR